MELAAAITGSRPDHAATSSTARSPKLIIIGHELLRLSGHGFNELLGYKAAAEALGQQVKIFLHAGSSPDLASLLSATQPLGALPEFIITPDHAVDQIIRYADGADAESYWRAIEAAEPNEADAILFTRGNATLVRGIGAWLGGRTAELRPAVFFRFLGDELVELNNGGYNSMAPVFRLATADLATRPGQERVFFLVNNSAVQRAVTRACRRRAFMMPMPKYLGETDGKQPDAELSARAVYVSINTRSGRLVPGLGKIIRSIQASDSAATFIVKFSADLSEACAAFANEGIANVEILPLGEPTADYLANLSRSTVVLLAYEPQFYRTLTSGIFTEARNLGKVVVAPGGTWMAEEIAAGRGAGTLFAEPTIEAVSAAVIEAIQSSDQLVAVAAAIAPKSRAENSCERVVELMLALAQTAPEMEPHYVFGEEIYFADALDSRCFMHGDWGRTEECGTWMVGKSAGLSLLLASGRQSPLLLRAFVFPFVTETHRKITVGVSLSGQRIAEWRFDINDAEGTGMRWCEAAIPIRTANGRPGHLDILFTMDNPRSPVEVGASPDLRVLGLGFRKLLIVEAT